MTSRIWQLAGVGLLGLGISLGALAEGPGDPGPGRPLNARDEVRQTQPPRQGYYQDIPRRHGNGWGPGPQYRPGHTVDRFPDRYWTVPYRGHDYFYSGGYWYRPHGGNYIVVTPPYGVRVNYLPPYAREVWVGGALFFLVADTYYQYLADSQEYVVVNPPAVAPPPAPPPPVAGGYDVGGVPDVWPRPGATGAGPLPVPPLGGQPVRLRPRHRDLRAAAECAQQLPTRTGGLLQRPRVQRQLTLAQVQTGSACTITSACG